MKNDEMVTDVNMLVTQNTITQDQIEEVNVYLEYEEGSRLLTNLGYSFYYNLMQQNMKTENLQSLSCLWLKNIIAIIWN